MHDDLDPQLLRRFASAARPLADQDFAASVERQLRGGARFGFSAGALSSLLGAVASGLGTALVLPWRLRHTRFMLAGAAAVSLWTAFL